MFYICKELENLYLSNFVTLKVTNKDGMFDGCLKEILLNYLLYN